MTSKNTGFDRLKITELFGPVLKLREAKRKEAFHTITDFTLLHVLRAEIRKYRESADRSEKTFFFFFHQKNPFG